MHGTGVFEYATIPGVIRSQVYMCPTHNCTSEKMATGDCNTYIQASSHWCSTATAGHG